MSLRKEPSGRRSVQVEVEVPGTPEQVWEAIATGPGVSSWFVPTEIRGDGTVVANFGPGMDSVSKVTAWEPPHRFAAESGDLGPESPSLATEWIVEARSGDTCIVRVVHSLFAATDDWDNRLESFEYGWPAFFRILRLYLAHFAGRPCSAFQLMGGGSGTAPEAWAALTAALGIGAPAAGERVETAGAPVLRGVAESVGLPEYPEMLLRLEAPAPGIGHLFALPMGGQTYLPMRVYLYGDQAASVAPREEAAWQAWFAERFPMPSP